MYRLYITKRGEFSDKNRHIKNNIEDVFSIIDNSIRKRKNQDDFTKYIVIESREGFGDRITLFFINSDLPYYGIDSYYDQRAEIRGISRSRNNRKDRKIR